MRTNKTLGFTCKLAMAILISSLPVIGGCSSDQGAELTPQQQRLRNGKELFSQSCASCHGTRGSGMGSRNGPALTRDDYRYGNTREAVFTSIHDGRPEGMPSFSSVFTREQIEALTEYVIYLQE